ncbi:hypothetical protein F0562_036081 [Nyssa sinensis]|uniref:Uncharacterized protein n=1 Tax=Nyssa sinensis TaxID=561372 RepID=A0A5J5AG78_9ASTE|nr:hypothetical protein F0562_036081 [Nyssa sinensis]
MMVQSVVLPQKRPFPTVDDSYSRRNYSAVATTAVASADAEEEESEDEDELEDLSWGEESGGQRDGETDSMRRLDVRLRTARLTRIKIRKVGEENMKPIKWVLEPKSQIGLAGLAAINGFFSA